MNVYLNTSVTEQTIHAMRKREQREVCDKKKMLERHKNKIQHVDNIWVLIGIKPTMK